jgi:uncharacterized protein (DUF2235 family)
MSAPTPSAGGPAPSGKTIVLFSDGTGNSSAKLFKTNVWRMYEAVDLGPPQPGRRTQIAYYDDGVGTSGFKPLAVLGGVFGYGLKRNVLDIYKYVCRNYAEGDQIYAFGFSRGAFTIRLVVALIAEEGLVPSKSEGQLDEQARCAYRHFRTQWLPRKLQWPTKWRRTIGALFNRTKYEPGKHARPDIRFVGVWDTVSAYGGPFAEFTRAIDNWIYPLSMPDYKLNAKVKRARHALALDDERDAFHPLLWDEVHEKTLIDNTEVTGVTDDRLQQVWFTGMHSDVGGGYPDESLSYVSLLWMMEEAEKPWIGETGKEEPGLNTLDVIKDRFRALASSAGPIHDSRKGVASYYRYQPRKIAAWVDPCDVATAGLRDPAITHDDSRLPKGLLKKVKVHESVISRISRGTDRYAPITLPETFEIFPPQAKGENAPQADSMSATVTPALQDGNVAVATRPRPLVSDELHKQLARPEVLKARAVAFEQVSDFVWRRRVAYFLTLAVTLLLATMPLWVDHVPESPILADGRNWVDAPLRLAGLVLPGVFASWIDTFATAPLYSVALLGCIWFGMRRGKRYERRLRDLGRGMWEAALDGEPPAENPKPGPLTRFRTSPRYQRTMQRFKWGVLPFAFLVVVLATAAWLGAAGATQIALPWLEAGTALCTSAGNNLQALTQPYTGDFKTSETCHAVGRTVDKGRRYRVWFAVDRPWFDASHATNPRGLRARDLGAAGIAGGPFRRVIEANYLQPVVEIRGSAVAWRIDSVHINPLELEEKSPGLYSGVFTATKSGELFVFPNDAVLLGNPAFFYQSSLGLNHGGAQMTIERLEDAPAIAALPRPEQLAGAGR